jgi:hypothetical protein
MSDRKPHDTARSAACECGFVVIGGDLMEMAERMRDHFTEAHPDKYVPPLEDIRTTIGKARMYGPHVRATFILPPADRRPRR